MSRNHRVVAVGVVWSANCRIAKDVMSRSV
jgi:hypothetical protein